MPTIATLDDKSQELLKRVKKEIGRYAEQPGTMRRGELAAVGGALDVLLKYVARWICDQEGLDPDVEAKLKSKASTLRLATSGQLVKLLGGLSNLPSAKRPEAQVFCKEAGKRGSRLERFVELRNPAIHDEAHPPGPEKVLPTLVALDHLITAYRRAAGFET